MAKRKLSRHQQKRIKKTQQTFVEDYPDSIDGLVISHHGGTVNVEMSDGTLIESASKSNLGAVVCGDRVVLEQVADQSYRIIAIKPRSNLLQRRDGFGQIKSVAANITQLLICIAVKPEPNLFLLDQYLLSAEQQTISPIIVLNKADLLTNPADDPFELNKIYGSLGYRIVCISVKENIGMDKLRSLFDNNTSVLSGVSGVGKSSITAALLPEENIKIAEISEVNEEGRHTTRTSRLYHLPNNGQLIDTPGIRGFNPILDPAQTVSSGFREIVQVGEHCRFSDCLHLNEPDCAVKKAVETGEITESRYQNFLRLQNG